MPMPLCHILRARLRQQGKADKSTLPVRDNSTLRLHSWRLYRDRDQRVLWIRFPMGRQNGMPHLLSRNLWES